MTNEIKEILDELESMFEISELEEQVNNINKIRDYITNLQEENEKLKRLAGKDYTELNIVEMKATIYKSRTDKAVEYINKYEYEKYCPSPYEKDKYIMREEKEGQDLLNILRGDE